MAIDVKSQLSQGSTQLGIIIAAVGNSLPYITPDMLASWGIPQPWVHGISSAIALALIVYQQAPKVPADAPKPPPAAGFITRNFAIFLAAVASAVMFLLMTGCVGLATFMSPSAMPLEQAAVGAAVFTTITNGKPSVEVQAARAARINAVAKQVLAIDQKSNMALVDVEIIVNAKIQSLNLPPPDLLLAQMLVATLGQALQAQLAVTSKGVISPQTQLAIADLCNWIIADTGG